MCEGFSDDRCEDLTTYHNGDTQTKADKISTGDISLIISQMLKKPKDNLGIY